MRQPLLSGAQRRGAGDDLDHVWTLAEIVALLAMGNALDKKQEKSRAQEYRTLLANSPYLVDYVKEFRASRLDSRPCHGPEPNRRPHSRHASWRTIAVS